MITRALALAAGLCGAAAMSQYPEFSQQYVQRLGGQVEALGIVVADFDASADRAGLTRDAALSELSGTAFLRDRQADMTRTFARYERLLADQSMLSVASPIERVFMPQRLRDAELLEGTWSDFKPAVPLTIAGAVAALVGFVLGGGIAAALWSVVGIGFRAVLRLLTGFAPRRAPAAARIEPRLRS